MIKVQVEEEKFIPKLIKFLILLIICLFVQIPAVAQNEIMGEWSNVVNGVRGRLIVSEDPPFNSTRMISVYLELQNVSDVGNPLEIHYNHNNLRGEVVNNKDEKIPAATAVASIIFSPSYWLVLPHDSSLRFRVSVKGYAVGKNQGALLGLSHNAWILKEDRFAPYFLQATFTATNTGDKKKREWEGILVLPKIQILKLKSNQ